MNAPSQALFKPSSAAAYLDIDVSLVYRLANEGKLEKRYIGKGYSYRIPIESLDAWRRGLPTEPREQESA